MEHLRKKLRKNPQWLSGHLLLAEDALTTYLHQETSPRLLATVRVSILAAERLGAPAPRLEYLRAMLIFLERNYEAAVPAMSRLLDAGTLDEKRTLVLQEHLAASLLTLGREDEARAIFESIEPTKLSGEGSIALSMLRSRNPTH